MLLLVFCVTPAFAIEDAENNTFFSEEEILDPELGLNFLSKEELQFLKENPDIATKRAQKDVDYLLRISQDNMNKSMARDIGVMAAQSLTLGTDKTFTTCDVGGKGGNEWGLAAADQLVSPSGKYARAKVLTNGIGNADAYAWVGPQVTVSGPAGSGQYADIIYKGAYSGTILGAVGGSAEASVKVSVWDYTINSEVDSYTIYNRRSTNIQPITVDNSINSTRRVYLRAGHTYAFRFGVNVAASVYNPMQSHSNFYNSLSQPRGITTSSVKVDF